MRVEVAAAYAMPLLLITVVLIRLQRLMPHRKGYVSLTGKGGERRPIELGPWRWAMFGYCQLRRLLSVSVPMVALVQAASRQGLGTGLLLDNLTLKNYHFLLFEHATRRSRSQHLPLRRRRRDAGVIITLGIAYIVKRQLVPFGGALGFLCMAPFVIPGIVLAIGFYAAYAPPPLALYGTARS